MLTNTLSWLLHFCDEMVPCHLSEIFIHHLQSASVQTKNISRPSWERTFTSTPRPRMREQHCRSWEVPTSSWRPPPAEPQSPAYFLAFPFAADSLWLASQATQFRSTEFR